MRQRAGSLVVRALSASPDWLLGLLWRHVPDSGIRRAVIRGFADWQYGRLRQTGVLPLELISPDIEAHQAPELMGTAGTFHGHAGMRAMWAELHEAWGTIEFEPLEIHEFGDRDGVVVVARARNVGLGSGILTDSDVAHVYRMDRVGYVIRLDTYWDPERALEAVGLRGLPPER